MLWKRKSSCYPKIAFLNPSVYVSKIQTFLLKIQASLWHHVALSKKKKWEQKSTRQPVVKIFLLTKYSAWGKSSFCKEEGTWVYRKFPSSYLRAWTGMKNVLMWWQKYRNLVIFFFFFFFLFFFLAMEKGICCIQEWCDPIIYYLILFWTLIADRRQRVRQIPLLRFQVVPSTPRQTFSIITGELSSRYIWLIGLLICQQVCRHYSYPML